MNISQTGLDMIKEYEGCKLYAYYDSVGVVTIGWGTTNADSSLIGTTIYMGMTITQNQADEWLEKSVNDKYVPLVMKYDSTYHWNQNQLDALTSFAYNLGSIDQLVDYGNRSISEISEKILAYNKAGGEVLAGLTRRRTAEKELFDTPYTGETSNSTNYQIDNTTTTTVTVDYTAIDPYIVTIDRNSKLDYAILKAAKVFGAVVEAGYRMETNGLVTHKFDNPNLSKQIGQLERYGIPYGLYTTCRARNSVEAKDEMYHLSYPLRKYGAQLGVWLKLEITKNNLYNTPILNQYKKELIRLGFKNKMGIICDRDFVKHIEWDTDDPDKANFKNDFYLWLVEHVESTDELDKLLDPEFFDIDGEG